MILTIFCSDLIEREKLEAELKVCETWLKYGISKHMGEASDCIIHNIPLGLALPVTGPSTADDDAASVGSGNNSDDDDVEMQDTDTDDDVEMHDRDTDDDVEMQERGADDDVHMQDIGADDDVEVQDIGADPESQDTGAVNSCSCSEENGTNPKVCASCKHLFFMLEHLKQMVKKAKNNKSIKSALRALRNCKKKIKLFMGHKIRVKNQQMEVTKILEDMKKELLENGSCSTCLITLDFKMKFDAKYFREWTLHFYGKRGMSWHGAMIQYYTLENVDGIQTPVLHKIYMDHIINNENKQDKAAVFAIMEAIVIGTHLYSVSLF